MKKIENKRRNLLSGMIAFTLAAMTFATTAFGAVIDATGVNNVVVGQGPGVTATAAETESSEKEDTQMSNSLNIDISKLQAAQDTDQLIVVVGNGLDSSHINVAYFTKDETGWKENFYVPGYCGYNGMSTDKREGDRRTPIGTFHFTQNFGSLANPGSKLPYKQLDNGDYWVDDSNSRYYNQMVNTSTTPVSWNSAEHLIGVMPQYRYAMALDYNTTERTPGKGSAIFLHGYHTYKTWTEGCIAIPEENVKTLVQQADANTKITIVPDLASLTYVD